MILIFLFLITYTISGNIKVKIIYSHIGNDKNKRENKRKALGITNLLFQFFFDHSKIIVNKINNENPNSTHN